MSTASIAGLQGKRTGRNGKYPILVSLLRDQIVAGKLLPGERIPALSELARQYHSTQMTVLRATGTLVDHGYLRTEERTGIFVAENPPHLSQFALAFPMADLEGHSRFYEAIRDEAAKLQAPERRVSAFYGIGHRVNVNDYQRLLGLMQAQRLAGLIFAGDPYQLMEIGSPLTQEPGVFRTAVMLPNKNFPFPSVYPDIDAFLPKAFDYLAARGRKRVAVVNLAGSADTELDLLRTLAAERGLIVRTHWIQAAFAGNPKWSRQLALVLLHEGQAERPDAVVISDDNLVEGFTEGIRASGISESDLEVVAQANFPYPTVSHFPATRLGYNITQLMATCLERIEQQRRGEDTPPHTAIPAEIEE